MNEFNGNKFISDTKQNYLKERTKAFALRIVRLVEGLPRSRTAHVLGKQLLEAGTSVGANYRAACRAKSQADFISKMGIVEEEAHETIYRMELLVLSDLVLKSDIADILDEANQILAMTVSSIKTARVRKNEILFRTPQSAFRILVIRVRPGLYRWRRRSGPGCCEDPVFPSSWPDAFQRF